MTLGVSWRTSAEDKEVEYRLTVSSIMLPFIQLLIFCILYPTTTLFSAHEVMGVLTNG